MSSLRTKKTRKDGDQEGDTEKRARLSNKNTFLDAQARIRNNAEARVTDALYVASAIDTFDVTAFECDGRCSIKRTAS